MAQRIRDISGRHPFIIIALAAVAVTLPLFAYVTPSLNNDDLLFYEIILREFAKQFWQGEMYPRWLYAANGGLGSPVFLFYGPVSFYLTSVFYPLHALDAAGSARFILSISSARIASGCLCYLWLKNHSKPWDALVITLLYLTLPYHIQEIYVRAALAGQWAMAVIFALLYFLDRLLDRRASGFFGVSVMTGLLIMTHLPTCVVFGWMPFLYLVFLSPAPQRISNLICLMAANLLAAGMAAVYLWPLWMNRGYIQMGNFISDRFMPTHNFLTPNEWYCLPYFLLAFLSLGSLIGRDGGKAQSWALSNQLFPKAFSRFLLAAFTVIVFLLLPVSIPLWNHFPPLQYLQFPFRFLTVALILLACFAGFLVRYTQYVFAVIIIWCAGLAFYACSVFLYAPQDYSGMLDHVSEHSVILPYEYSTRWSFSKEDRDAAMTGKIINDAYRAMPKVSLVSGSGTLEALPGAYDVIAFKADIVKRATVLLRWFYFPGMEITDMKTGRMIQPEANAPEGFLSVALAPGHYVLEARITHFTGEALGKWISLGSLILLIVGCAVFRFAISNDCHSVPAASRRA